MKITLDGWEKSTGSMTAQNTGEVINWDNYLFYTSTDIFGKRGGGSKHLSPIKIKAKYIDKSDDDLNSYIGKNVHFLSMPVAAGKSEYYDVIVLE